MDNLIIRNELIYAGNKKYLDSYCVGDEDGKIADCQYRKLVSLSPQLEKIFEDDLPVDKDNGLSLWYYPYLPNTKKGVGLDIETGLYQVFVLNLGYHHFTSLTGIEDPDTLFEYWKQIKQEIFTFGGNQWMHFELCVEDHLSQLKNIIPLNPDDTEDELRNLFETFPEGGQMNDICYWWLRGRKRTSRLMHILCERGYVKKSKDTPPVYTRAVQHWGDHPTFESKKKWKVKNEKFNPLLINDQPVV